MGFPSTGLESLWRNNVQDVKNFFTMNHKDVKVYNLNMNIL